MVEFFTPPTLVMLYEVFDMGFTDRSDRRLGLEERQNKSVQIPPKRIESML
jgi:hypothetical protein